MFNNDTQADVRELTAEELETVAGGNIFLDILAGAQALADATGGEKFFEYVNKLVRG